MDDNLKIDLGPRFAAEVTERNGKKGILLSLRTTLGGRALFANMIRCDVCGVREKFGRTLFFPKISKMRAFFAKRGWSSIPSQGADLCPDCTTKLITKLREKKVF